MPYTVLLPNLSTRLDSKDSVFFLNSRDVEAEGGDSSQEAGFGLHKTAGD